MKSMLKQNRTRWQLGVGAMMGDDKAAEHGGRLGRVMGAWDPPGSQTDEVKTAIN